MFRTLDDLEPGQRVLVRLDLNSPVEGEEVQDNRRFSRHAGTVSELLADDHAVTILAHQGRPGRDTFVPLEQHAAILSEHVGHDVGYVPDTHGDEAIEAIRALEGGEALLLENVRMVEDELRDLSPEEHAESDLVTDLAPEFDAYVNDAYSAAHRGHASLVGFPRVLPAYAGRVMEAEYEANTAIRTREFDGHVAMVLGGTKADDLIDVMERAERVDTFLLGGIVGELFLRASGAHVGYDVEGSDLFDEQWAESEGTIRDLLARYGDRIVLPVDLAYEDEEGGRSEVFVADAEKSSQYLDVGRETVSEYAEVIAGSDAAFVKGALGVFEDERFSDGTVGVLESIAGTECFSVVGGGDTSRAIGMYGLNEEEFSHVSIAGGAYARALTGEPLVAIEALER